MKKLVALAIVGLLVAPAMAQQTYMDAVGDLNDGTMGGVDFTAFTHLDIAELTISNTLSDISFAITLDGDILATDWGKYMIIIDSIPGGDPDGNGWARPIGMAAGADYWIGSWVDSGNGAETYHYDQGGEAWVRDHATWDPPSDIFVESVEQFTVTLTTTLDSLGLSVGDTFDFDLFSSGGGGSDGAIDSLGNPDVQVMEWDEYSEAYLPSLSYTVVPEPVSVALLALGGLALIRRR